MTLADSSTPDYTLGFSEEILASFLRFTAETHSKLLLPHLKPGHRVLDVGCGPGHLSIGLARAVEPDGELHGIDLAESQIRLARLFARRGGYRNATFQVADALELPYEDCYFDAVHCHTILTYIPDTETALAEIMRVLKPGGIVFAREMICESSFTHPEFGVLGKAWEVFSDLIETDDGHPNMGKDIKFQFQNAGFTNLQAGASFDFFSHSEDIEFIYWVTQGWFLSPEITEAGIKYGAATQELYDAIGAAYARWKDHPAPICAICYGELLAWKPPCPEDA